jgi:antitoxin PrlF
MKAILSVSSRGLITLPAKFRRAVGIHPDDSLIAETTDEGILLRPSVTLPVEMYSEKQIKKFDEAEAALSAAMAKRKPRRRQV